MSTGQAPDGQNRLGAAALESGRVTLPPEFYDVIEIVDGKEAVIRKRDQPKAEFLRGFFGGLLFSSLITYIPVNAIRVGFLRLLGARIGAGVRVGRGTCVLAPEYLTLEGDLVIGERCLLDARGGLTLGHHVILGPEAQILAGGHDVFHPNFLIIPLRCPILIEDYAWIGARAMVTPAHIGRGAVIDPMAVVTSDIPALAVAGGMPAKQRATRDPAALQYSARGREVIA